MRFMVIVKGNQDSEAGKLPDEQMLADMANFNEELVKAGVMKSGEGLHPTAKGTRVRLSNGSFTVTDGPFAEAKEIIAGYWIIETPTREDAVNWLKRAPFVEGDVDLHPMFDGEEPQLAPRDESKRRYLSIYFPANAAAMSTKQMPTQAEIERMGRFMEQHVRTGALIGSGGLLPGAKPARVAYSGKSRTVVDGPFSEAKEVIGGFGMLQTRTKEDVIQLAKDFLQVAGDGLCEIRPVYELSDFPAGDAIDHHQRLKDELAKR
jgi:hypothetical protein